MGKTKAMWVVISMAHSESRAKAAYELLTREGFMVKTRVVAKTLSSGEACYELLALTSEAKEARDLLQESGY